MEAIRIERQGNGEHPSLSAPIRAFPAVNGERTPDYSTHVYSSEERKPETVVI